LENLSPLAVAVGVAGYLAIGQQLVEVVKLAESGLAETPDLLPILGHTLAQIPIGRVRVTRALALAVAVVLQVAQEL
jgi:ubiquinone biosynthesis protein UbiJ